MKELIVKAKDNKLFTVGNTKTQKGEKLGYITLILHLSPHKQNTMGINVCPNATTECIEACLNESGRQLIFPAIKAARIRKTDEFLQNRKEFAIRLMQEIEFYKKKAKRAGMEVVVRLNGTSDINWTKLKITDNKTIFELLPTVQFYDYTKNVQVATRSLTLPNYDITFSWSGDNEADCRQLLAVGVNVAVPFQNVKKNEAFCTNFLEHEIIDGDITDLRFLDSKGKVVGLRVKGIKQKKITSNFLVQIESTKQKAA
jgi:hypothetical protein